MILSYRTAGFAASLAFFICCLVKASYKTTSPVASSLDLVCDQRVFDYGTRATGDSISREFIVRNASSHEIEIADVRSGCSCATATIDQTRLSPGHSAKVTVHVSLENLRGNVEQHIVVETASPKNAVLLLKLKGHVESAYSVVPRNIDFGTIDAAQRASGSILVEATGLSFLPVTVTCDSPLCRVQQETVEQGKKYRLSVLLIDDVPAGFWRTALRIRTDHPKEPLLVVPVVARVRKTILATKG